MNFLRTCIALIINVVLVTSEIQNKGWWKNAIFYQIYPRSFMDSNNDGVGDLAGITNKLEYFVEAGITAIWLSPIYASPMIDFGYDISDFRAIDPSFGTMEDFEALMQKAKKLGLKVVMDFVPNHTSDQHEWFIKSVNGDEKYKDYYIWATGQENNTKPPNNWISLFTGPAWFYNETRGLWYFHQFEYRQPDLNFYNPDIHKEMEDILTFWLEKGIDGFRIDAIIHIYEKEGLPDEPLSHAPGATDQDYNYLEHIYTKNDPKDYDLIRSWRTLVDEWADSHNEDEKVIMTEAYTSLTDTIKYYSFGSHIPFNFNYITEVNVTSKPSEFKKVFDDWIALMPDDQCANWVMGNHDRSRIATRYPNRTDQMTILALILPGVGVTYYGEEIGMEDNTKITWEQTKDPSACHLNPQTFLNGTRDPERTPFQWDDTVNAGFNAGAETWLPINENYKDLNLKKQKLEPESHFTLYQTLAKLRQTSLALKNGTTKIDSLNNNTVFAVVRQGSDEGILLLINFSDDTAQEVNASDYLPGAIEGTVVVSSIGSNIKWSSPVMVSSIQLPPKVTLVIFAKINSSLSNS